jgi:hypothetical protein
VDKFLSSLKYCILTLKHKGFVLLAGLKIGCPVWRLIKHDWTKFLPSELSHYGNQFFGNKDNPYNFTRAWLHHQNMNDHHWEYWIPRTGHNRSTPLYPDGVPLEMDYYAVEEMVADWLGASRAYEGNWPKSLETWVWFKNNFDKIKLHPSSRSYVLYILKVHVFKIYNTHGENI